MKSLCQFAVLVVITMVAPAASGTSFSYSGPAANDVDTNPATVVTLTVPDSGAITDLTLFVNIGTPFADDVSIFLFHDGTQIEVYQAAGDTSSAVITATFDDQAGSSYPVNGSAIGTFLPFQPLSGFNGLDINGDWQLQLLDNFFPGDGTPLLAWNISGDTESPVPEPGSIGLVAVGLATFFVAARRVPKRSRRPGTL